MVPMDKTLIISDQCSACKALLEALKNQGVLDKYHVVNIASPEGQDIVQKLGLTAVPECLVVVKDGSGEMARKCSKEEIIEVLKEAGGVKDRT